MNSEINNIENVLFEAIQFQPSLDEIREYAQKRCCNINNY